MIKKYRMFIATFTRVNNLIGCEKQYLVANSLGTDGITHSVVSNAFDSAEKAAEYARAQPDDVETVTVEMTKPAQRLISESELFETESGAKHWCRQRAEQWPDHLTGSNVEAITVDEDDLEGYEHHPCYKVTVKVTTTKLLDVEIDTADSGFEDIEDEYDATQHAISMVEDGALEHELEYADVWDTDVDEYECIEQ